MATTSTSSVKEVDEKRPEIKIEFTNVKTMKDGIKYCVDFTNKQGIVPETAVMKELALVKRADSFQLKNYRKVNLEVCYEVVTNSLIMNDLKRKSIVQTVNEFSSRDEIKTMYIVPDLAEQDKINVVSFNRFMAVCTSAIRVSQFGKIYDWTKDQYVKVTESTRFEIDNSKYGNKLALAIGMPVDHPYYWFYTTGYEYTFEYFPIEVVAMTIFRLKNQDSLKLKNMKVENIVKATTAQIAKKGSLLSVMEKLGKERILEQYNIINSNRTHNASAIRHDEFKNFVSSIFQL